MKCSNDRILFNNNFFSKTIISVHAMWQRSKDLSKFNGAFHKLRPNRTHQSTMYWRVCLMFKTRTQWIVNGEGMKALIFGDTLQKHFSILQRIFFELFLPRLCGHIRLNHSSSRVQLMWLTFILSSVTEKKPFNIVQNKKSQAQWLNRISEQKKESYALLHTHKEMSGA